jgi:ABC-type multidrug transport system ATPase subunit/pSer/pThr/pTyr-binding forkhead associated (FHA) protein
MNEHRTLLLRLDGESRFPAHAGGTITIGRAPDNSLVLDDPEASRHHARIEPAGDGYQITDLSSGNGTRHNERSLRPETPTVLNDGDSIAIGTATFRFRSTPAGPRLIAPSNGTPAPNTTAGIATAITRPAAVQRPPSTLPTVALPALADQMGDTLSPVMHLDLRGRERLLIGRLPANDLVLDHPAVSRFHARISRHNDSTVLEDLESSNGTFVNGERVPPGDEIYLRPGDTIHIGTTRLLLAHDALEQRDESRDLRLDALHLNQPVGKGVNLLQDISLSINPREFVAVVGVSGAGKSTLLGALNGFRPARQGTVLVNGGDLYREFDAHRANLGYVPQDDIIHTELTVGRALDYAAQLRLPADTTAAERRQRVDEVLETLGLTERHDVPVRDLSGGQRKRVSIGVELLTKPGLFFLDEATSGLDPGTELQMMRLLRGLADEGHTVLLVTHATKNVALCDQVIFLARGGYLAYYGPPDAALRYFGVEDFDAIYEKLEGELTPAEWAERYHASPPYQTYVAARLAERFGPMFDAPAAVPRQKPAASGEKPAPAGGGARAARVSAPRQMRVLSTRYLDIIRRDRMGLILLFLVPILLGAIDLLAWPRDILDPTTGAADRSMTMLFLATIMPFLIGGLGSAREIVKESAIYRRERMVTLKIAPYLLSKVWVAALFSLYSAAVLLAFKLLAVDLSVAGASSIGKLYVTLALAVMSGAMVGLLISALARREEQVMMLVVLVVVVQIVFSGGILPLRNLGAAGQVLGSVTSSKWVFEAQVAAVEVKRGDCDGASLQDCHLPGIERLDSDAERRVLVNQVDERFRDVFGQSIYRSWAALLTIMAVLFALLVLLQRRKDAT